MVNLCMFCEILRNLLLCERFVLLNKNVVNNEFKIICLWLFLGFFNFEEMIIFFLNGSEW